MRISAAFVGLPLLVSCISTRIGNSFDEICIFSFDDDGKAILLLGECSDKGVGIKVGMFTLEVVEGLETDFTTGRLCKGRDGIKDLCSSLIGEVIVRGTLRRDVVKGMCRLFASGLTIFFWFLLCHFHQKKLQLKS